MEFKAALYGVRRGWPWHAIVMGVLAMGCKGPKPEKAPTCEELADHWVDTTLAFLDDPREKQLEEPRAREAVTSNLLASCADWSEDSKRCFGKAKTQETFYRCWNRGQLDMARAGSKAAAANVAEVEKNFSQIMDAVVRYHRSNPDPSALEDMYTRFPEPLNYELGCCHGCLPSDDAYSEWSAIDWRPAGKHFLHYALSPRKTYPNGREYSVSAFGDVDCDGNKSLFSVTFCVGRTELVECSELNPELLVRYRYRSFLISNPHE